MTLSIREHIEADPPNVWLTSFWGWSPDVWGCVGFDEAGRRDTVLREGAAGSLWVCYVTYTAPNAPEAMRGKVVGFYQLGDETGHSSQFIEPSVYARYAGRWTHAIRAIGAWTLHEDDWIDVEVFAPETYRNAEGKDRGRSIGKHGRRLLASEAQNLLSLRATAQPLYGADAGPLSQDTVSVTDLLSPSRPGPAVEGRVLVDRTRNTAKELYVLKLHGGASRLLDPSLPVVGRSIFKVGLSHAPEARLSAYNLSLPKCMLRWTIDRSTLRDGHDLYPDQATAEVGETAMKEWLHEDCDQAISLGGEFFLATDAAMDRAWEIGRDAALACKAVR